MATKYFIDTFFKIKELKFKNLKILGQFHYKYKSDNDTGLFEHSVIF